MPLVAVAATQSLLKKRLHRRFAFEVAERRQEAVHRFGRLKKVRIVLAALVEEAAAAAESLAAGDFRFAPLRVHVNTPECTCGSHA